MFRITLNKTWKMRGLDINYVKYLQVEDRNEIFKYWGISEISRIEKI